MAEAVAAARGGRGSIEPKVRLNSSCDHRLSGRPVFEQTRAPCHTRELGIVACYNFMPLRSTGHVTFSRGCKDASIALSINLFEVAVLFELEESPLLSELSVLVLLPESVAFESEG